MLKVIKFLFSYILFQFSRISGGFSASIFAYADRNTFLGERSNISTNRLLNCNVGRYSYIGKTITLSNLKVGSFSSIAQDFVILSGRHPLDYVSTSPCFYSGNNALGSHFIKNENFQEFKLNSEGYACTVGSDVWIGFGVRVMDGVTIGNGSVIAAGALLTKDIPPYEIWAGIPAKKISTRFEKEQVERLILIEWWNKPTSWLHDKAHLFHDINKFIEKAK
jgi:acetyltransferase-like isoleucine patch superfamily enzyme